MGLPTQRLRVEHEGFREKVESFRVTAQDVGIAPVDDLRDALEEAYLFLEETLLPHARAEDLVLYPAINRILGYDKATVSMTLDHVEIGTLANEMGLLRLELIDEEQPTAELLQEMRRVLYGLYALIKAHVGKEETLYFPLIDANMTPEEAGRLFDSMESMGHTHRFAVT